MLAPNRNGSAWLVWAPLGFLLAVTALPPGDLGLFSEFHKVMLEPVLGLAFGLAAVWLLMPQITKNHRFLTFVGFLLVLSLVSGLTMLIRNLADGGGVEAIPGVMALAISLPMIAGGLSLAGLICRRRYQPSRLSLWLFVLLLGAAILIVTPFFLFAYFASGGNVPITGLVASISFLGGSCFVLVLPFLLLSFTSGFYRNRLKAMLRMDHEENPPILARSPEAGEWIAK